MRPQSSRCFAAVLPIVLCLLCACLSGTTEEADSARRDADAVDPNPVATPAAQPETDVLPEAGPASPNVAVGSTPDPGSPNLAVSPNAPISPNVPITPTLRTTGYIASALDPMACLDRPVNATVAPGQYIVQMYTCNYTVPQTFVRALDGSLKASDTNRCLTLPAPGADANLAIITAQACSDTAQNQKWDTSGGTWRNRANGQCLDIVSGDPGAGSRLTTAACTGAKSQQWQPLTDPNTPVADPLASATTLPARCSPTIALTFTVGEANQQLIEQRLPNFVADARQAALDVCAIAFDRAADVPPARSTLLLRIRPSSAVGVAYSVGHEIDVGFDYLADKIKQNDLQDVRGMLHHEITHYYQKNACNAPSWLIEGMAEFVRFKSGYVNAVPTKGKPYTDGYAASGFFLIWLEGQYPGFFRQLMVDIQQASPAWDMGYFQKKTGKAFDDLWNAYQKSAVFGA